MKPRYFFLRTEDLRILGPFSAAMLDRMYHRKVISGESPISADKVHWMALQEVLYETEQGSGTIEILPSGPGSGSRADITEQGWPVEGVAEEENLCGGEGTNGDQFCPEGQSPELFRVIGNTLTLCWNAPEKLAELALLPSKVLWTAVLPVCLGFPFLITAAAAFSVSLYFPGVGRKLLFAAGMTAGMLFLSLAGMLGFHRRAALPKETLVQSFLLAGMILMNTGALFCVEILNYAVSVLAPRETVPAWGVWSYGILTLGVFAFFCANFVLGLRKGLKVFYMLSSRGALFGAAFFAGLSFAVLKAAELLAAKIL